MELPAGETELGDIRVGFDRSLKLEFHGSYITSDAGLLPFRDLDDALGLTEIAATALSDIRTGKNGRHSLIAQFRQSLFGRVAGYEDVNDADRLAKDPAMRWIVGGCAIANHVASTSQMARFETEVLTQNENMSALTDLSGQWIDIARSSRLTKTVVLDMDSSVSPTHGDQEGTAYNGHFECTCYHPLFVFNQFGELERCVLRSGNVHSADAWRSVMEPVVARYRGTTRRRYFRGDAAFALPDLYEFLEDENYLYAIRLKANANLQRFYDSFFYQAASWSKARRVVAKVEWHPGELYPRIGFIVTNLSRPANRVVNFYNQRDTAEQWIKEGKNAIKWTRLSCRSMHANAARLQLHALAYNLANFLRTLALPPELERWSLTTIREKLIKIGGKVVAHARYTTFQMAEVAVPRLLFNRVLQMIDHLRRQRAALC